MTRTSRTIPSAQYVPLNKVVLNPENPRVIKDARFEKLKRSIQEFPDMLLKRPLVVVKHGKGKWMVLGGNARLKACTELGLEEVPVLFADNWTAEQRKQFIIKDNVSFGDWDWEVLSKGFSTDELGQWGVDLPSVTEDQPPPELDDRFTDNVGTVIYEPSSSSHPTSSLYVRETKFDDDIAAINDPHLREMLTLRVAHFSTFNFAKIADYYAYQATAEEQRIFERMALVLLDRDQLIEHGLADLIGNANTTEA